MNFLTLINSLLFRESLGKARISQVNITNITLIFKFHGSKAVRPGKSPLGYGGRITIIGEYPTTYGNLESELPQVYSRLPHLWRPSFLALASQ